jgi:hypothetical protein
MRRTVLLQTPPVPRIAPEGIFDAFGWCASQELEWALPTGAVLDLRAPITSANPPGMVFVMRGDATAFLPRELASLHAPGLGLTNEWALAPWAIDDATDLLYEHRAPPGEHLWLATGSLAGLVWGLHDWAHFHNHGAFEPEQRAWTELQCDAAALAWTWMNRAAIGIEDAAWEVARSEVEAVAAGRFAAEGARVETEWLETERVRGLLSRSG